MTHDLSTKIITISLCVLLTFVLVFGALSPVQAESSLVTSLSVYSQSGYNSSTHVVSGSSGTFYVTFSLPSYATTSGSTFYIYGSLTADNGGTASNACQIRNGASSSNQLFSAGSYDDFSSALASGIECTSTGNTVITFAFLASNAYRSYDLSQIYISDSNPNPPATSSFSIPYGNVAVLDLTRTTISLDLSTTFREKSALFGSPFPDYGYWGTMATLPTDGYTFDQSSSNTIVWSKGQPRDLLGSTYNGVYSLDSTSLNRFLYIVNPYTSAPSPDGVLSSITVSGIPEGVVVHTYPLLSTLSNYGAVVATLEDSSLGGSGEATASGGAINFTDGNGDVYTSPDGGLNSPTDVTQSVVDYINSISKTLDNFVESFLNLLKAPISHIQQLVSSGSAFMQSLSTMFTWLPEPVQAVITSGLVLLVVIGVLKLLL